MTMAKALSVTLVHLSIHIRHTHGCPLSKSNSFDLNFIKLGHIVKYHDVFLKLDNGPYRTMPSGVMALCL